MRTLLSVILGILGIWYLVHGKRRSKINFMIIGGILILASYFIT